MLDRYDGIFMEESHRRAFIFVEQIHYGREIVGIAWMRDHGKRCDSSSESFNRKMGATGWDEGVGWCEKSQIQKPRHSTLTQNVVAGLILYKLQYLAVLRLRFFFHSNK